MEYKKDHPDGLVPVKYETEDGIKLGSWVTRIRRAFHKETLKPEYYERLKEAGFPFYYYSTYWHRSYLEAKAFYEEHGDLHVPMTYVEENGSSIVFYDPREYYMVRWQQKRQNLFVFFLLRPVLSLHSFVAFLYTATKLIYSSVYAALKLVWDFVSRKLVFHILLFK